MCVGFSWAEHGREYLPLPPPWPGPPPGFRPLLSLCGRSLYSRYMQFYSSQSDDWYRGPTEIVQNFAFRGSLLRRKGAARHIIYMFWLYRSPIPVGRRGKIFTCSPNDFNPPSRLLQERSGGGSQHPVARTERCESALVPRKKRLRIRLVFNADLIWI